MHEAYKRIEFDKTYDGYGTFISGPSKTADIAQVLVMGGSGCPQCHRPAFARVILLLLTNKLKHYDLQSN